MQPGVIQKRLIRSKAFLFIILGLIALLILIPFAKASAATTPITLYVNGSLVKPDVDPFVYQNRTMVPLRFVSGPLSADLAWDSTTKTVTLTKWGLVITLTIGDTTAIVNGVEVECDTAAMAKDGRTFVPVRFISENLGGVVDWNSTSRRVSVVFAGESKALNITGYYYDSKSLTMLQNFTDTFDDVIHFGYSIAADGTVSPKQYFNYDLFESQGYDCTLQNGIRPMLLITAFEKASCTQLLTSDLNRAAAIENICALVEAKGMTGVNLDFEAVAVECRDYYTQFVKDLKQALGTDKVLSLSLHPRTYGYQTWLDGYDYGGLATCADELIIMFYNEHYSGGTPGPVAGASWMRTSIEYLLQYIPADKLHAGLGVYGYSWPEGGKGTSVHVGNAVALAQEKGATIQRDEKSGVPWFTYVGDDGVIRQLWFEDAQSMAQKAALAKEYGLAGIAVWRMGIVPDDIWLAIVHAVQ